MKKRKQTHTHTHTQMCIHVYRYMHIHICVYMIVYVQCTHIVHCNQKVKRIPEMDPVTGAVHMNLEHAASAATSGSPEIWEDWRSLESMAVGRDP